MHTIAPDRLIDLATAIFVAEGCPEAEAVDIAERLVEANLKGHDSHGAQLIPLYVQRMRDGMIKPGQHVSLAQENGPILVMDGNHGFGQVVGREAIERAMTVAREKGIALLALRQVHHLGRIGYWAEMCAAQGLVSVHFVNVTGARFVAPHGGIDRRFGTNPITMGMPGPNGQPIILDMATSQVAAGKVAVAQRKGVPVPAGSLIGEDGCDTTDASRLYGSHTAALKPFGAHKGFGLAFFCELLAGALTGSVGNHPQNGLGNAIYNNMLSIIIDADAMSPYGSVMEEVQRICDWTLSARPIPGMEVMLPGEPERRAAAERKMIEIAPDTWDEIQALAPSA